MGALDGDAAEHGDRARRGDRHGPRSRGAQLHRRDVRDGLTTSDATRLTSSERRREHDRQLEQQRADQQHHPRESTARGAISKSAVAAARQQPGQRCAAPARARPAPLAFARVDRRERVAREDVAQRAEHRHDRGAASRRRRRWRCSASSRLAASRRRRPSERKAGIRVEEVDRELLAEQQPERARDQPRARARRAAAPR